ncbi:uncharacterized protein LOC115874879 [Sitophilus oryzae]|uniref:Uncharacterized protein LOC115874879 n=1 Tax=Sitophilus oryzae TaxID=7048 RepID=A0A6J2X4F2_SITOR|nr:uncharacterized protein LOC115874879 [Sitophilus oryzae]
MEKIKFNALRIYNVDETGITTVQSKHPRVISLKGKKQVCAVTAAERGALVTVVFCMNAAGGFVPPLFVFPRKNMKAELLDGAPPGSIAACHPSDWIQQHIFTQWLKHFIAHGKPTENDPVLLVLDGHYSHTRNLDVIEIARSNHLTIICIPPHTSHKLEPLDLSFMAPFKTYYSQSIQSWLKNNPDRNVTAFQICKLMSSAYLKDAFSDVDFVIERQRERTPPQQDSYFDLNTSENVQQLVIQTTPEREKREEQETLIAPKVAKKPSTLITAEDIIPIPSCSGMQNTSGKRKGKQGSSNVITSTPYKNELEISIHEKERKESLKNKKNVKRNFTENDDKGKSNKKDKSKGQEKSEGKKTKPLKKPKLAIKKKKGLPETSSSSSEEDPILDDDSDMNASDVDVECMFCNGLFSEDGKKNG